ncbi:MAG: ACT domain-containing protein, partial [Candidatus Omnitrophica bacterium]|nr:ACT domain-containing protein [Candidatus Omnitrophota bacterium]
TYKEKTVVCGTLVTRNKPRIVRINDFYIDAIPEGTLLVTYALDKAGIVGQIGTILGNNNVNIAAMNFGRTAPGGNAIIVMNVDSEISEEVLENIKKCDSIVDVKMIRL